MRRWPECDHPSHRRGGYPVRPVRINLIQTGWTPETGGPIHASASSNVQAPGPAYATHVQFRSGPRAD